MPYAFLLSEKKIDRQIDIYIDGWIDGMGHMTSAFKSLVLNGKRDIMAGSHTQKEKKERKEKYKTRLNSQISFFKHNSVQL